MIDPRGPRFGAWITSAVLVTALLVPAPASAALLSAQALVFALGSRGHSPYQWLFRVLVRRHLAPPEELEDERPPRFAQVVGLVFATAAATSVLAGATLAGQVFTGMALVAALLNAAVGLCLGCELYLIFRRTYPATTSNKGATA